MHVLRMFFLIHFFFLVLSFCVMISECSDQCVFNSSYFKKHSNTLKKIKIDVSLFRLVSFLVRRDTYTHFNPQAQKVHCRCGNNSMATCTLHFANSKIELELVYKKIDAFANHHSALFVNCTANTDFKSSIYAFGD